jgi:hypothetical protein
VRAPRQPIGIRQRQILPSAIGLVGLVLALLALLLVVGDARSEGFQPWVPVGPGLVLGLRAAYDRRSDGTPIRLVWAGVYGAGTAAIIVAFGLGLGTLAKMIRPWVLSHGWPTETTIAVGAVGFVLIVMATIVGDDRPTALRRGLALWAAIVLLVFGLWLVSQGGLVGIAGIVAALSAPVIHYQSGRTLNRADAAIAKSGAAPQADAPP